MGKWGEIGKSGNDGRFFEDKRKNIISKNRNRFHAIHEGDYKKNPDPNPHTNPNFYANPWLGDVRLATILSLCLISFSAKTLNIKQCQDWALSSSFLLVS